MKQKGTRYGSLILFLFLAFTLLCSLSAMAQQGSISNPSTLNNGTAPVLQFFYSDPLTYTLNGNRPPSEPFYNTTTSLGNGEWYRGEGGSLVPFVSGVNDGSNYTSQSVCANMFANFTTTNGYPACNLAAPVTGCVSPQMVQVQIGGSSSQSMYCCSAWKATVSNGTVTWGSSSYGYCSAGNWSSQEAFLLDENLNYNLGTYGNQPGSPVAGHLTGTGANQGAAQQCLGCHGHENVESAYGPAYLLSGHKNALRRVVPGIPLADATGTPYSGVNWTNGTLTSNGAPVYYLLGGWIESSPIVYSQGSPSYLGDCFRCHTTGWNPVAPFTDTTAATAAYSGYASTLGSLLNTQSGPEPSVAALTANLLFNGTLNPTFYDNTTDTYKNASGIADAANGYQSSPGVPTYTFAALPSGALSTAPGTMTDGASSWYLNGVTCERCHYNNIGVQNTSVNGTLLSSPTGFLGAGKDLAQRTSGGSVNYHAPGGKNGDIVSSATYPPGTSDANAAHGMNSTMLCVQCHRSETITAGTVASPGRIDVNWPVKVATDGGSCANGSGDNFTTCTTTDGSTWNFVPTIYENQGTEMLASPHAKYIGPVPQMNNQNTADPSFANGTLNSAANYLSINLGNSGNDGYGNNGCVGCHDPHFTTRNVPNDPTNPSWGVLYSSLANDGSPPAVPVGQGPQAAMVGLLRSDGTMGAQSHNCDDAACHGGSMQTLTHSTGPGTPFPTGTSSDFPGACFTCHMQGSSGVAQSHLFRVNPSATYYTYPTAAQFYSGTAALNPDPTAFVLYNGTTLVNGTYTYNGTISYGVPSPAMINTSVTDPYAVANDVDIVCGQCHGGGGSSDSRGDTNPPYTNPYGIPSPGAPYFTRNYLASVAANMHGTPIQITLTAPTFSPGSESSATSLSVTLSDATTTATICYTTNGVNPTATTAGTCDSLGGAEIGVASGTSITVAKTETVKAIATAVGDLNSSLAYATYTIGAKAATPTFSLKAGTYTLKTATSTLSSTLSDATSGATICYTANGTTPTATVAGTCDSLAGETGVPSGTSITIAQAETVMAIATLAGDVNSGVFSATYALIPAPPTFSPGSETYYQLYVTTSYPSVTLTAASSATISYCEVAAGQPACTPSTAYTASISVSCISGNPPCGVTIYANAVFSGGTASSSSHATYFIKPGDPPGTPHAATPTFSPLPGVITATESVTISDSSTGVCSIPTYTTQATCVANGGTWTSVAPVICYTLNGPVPEVNPATGACTVGTVYTGPVPLNAVEGNSYTLRAVAGGAGYLQSEPIAKGEYIFR